MKDPGKKSLGEIQGKEVFFFLVFFSCQRHVLKAHSREILNTLSYFQHKDFSTTSEKTFRDSLMWQVHGVG